MFSTAVKYGALVQTLMEWWLVFMLNYSYLSPVLLKLKLAYSPSLHLNFTEKCTE